MQLHELDWQPSVIEGLYFAYVGWGCSIYRDHGVYQVWGSSKYGSCMDVLEAQCWLHEHLALIAEEAQQ